MQMVRVKCISFRSCLELSAASLRLSVSRIVCLMSCRLAQIVSDGKKLATTEVLIEPRDSMTTPTVRNIYRALMASEDNKKLWTNSGVPTLQLGSSPHLSQ